jgi:hypothetical protein
MNNRRAMGNLPFNRINNRQLQDEQSAMRHVFGQNHRARVIVHDLHAGLWYANSVNSRYTLSYDLQVPSMTEMTNAVQLVRNEMLNLFDSTNSQEARVRIVYEDRQAVVNYSRTSRVFRSMADFAHTGFQAIADTLVDLLSSNDILDLGEAHFIIDFNLPGYVGAGGVPASAYNELYKDCRGLTIIKPASHNLCGWITLALFMLKYYGSPEEGAVVGIPATFYDIVPITRYSLFSQVRGNTRLMNKVGKYMQMFVTSPREAFSPDEDFELLQLKFPWLKIVVMTGKSGNVEFDKKPRGWPLNPNSDLEKCVCYMHFDTMFQHYCLIDNVKAHVNDHSLNNLNRKKFCHVCYVLVPANEFAGHPCMTYKCSKCVSYFASYELLTEHWDPALELPAQWELQFNEEEYDFTNLKCQNCLVDCHNFTCLQFHIKNMKCNNSRMRRIVCPECSITHLDRGEHNCDPERVVECKSCGETFMAKDRDLHRCFMQTLNTPNGDIIIEDEGKRFYSFDFESQFLPGPQKIVNGRDGGCERIVADLHEVNFVCVRQCFTGNRFKFSNMLEFSNWIKADLQSQSGKEIVMIAHNLKGYDGRLLFDHYCKILQEVPEDVMWNGTKIMSMRIDNILFRDSLLHFATSLENLPKIFGLDENQFAKGFFPYKFSVPANQAYVGPIPSIQMFSVDMMSSTKRKQFLQWYEEQRNVEYDFRKELERYCISDVDILAESLEVYMREGMLMNSNLNPMDCTTIASYAFKVYRTLHMPAGTICVLNKQELDFAKEAMHGGRTDVRQMMKTYTSDQVERGIYAKYQDVQSLYPYIQFFKELPSGIPVVHEFCNENTGHPTDEEISTWFGIVKCDLDPPGEYLHHPVVVGKSDGKLIADLLPKKGKVLTTPELNAAISKGYIVRKVYEYHQYTPSTELFKSYLRQYLTVKIQCSGMPAYIRTDSDWQEFSDYHRTVLGIELDRALMIKNSGKKQIAKLMLNSLWGKFAESKSYSQQINISNREDFKNFEMLWDTCKIDLIATINISGVKQVMIYKNSPDSELVKYDRKRASKSNMALASFVTAWGALILWEQMDKLGPRVIYHDTDSIIYEHDPERYNIPEGRYLGEWEDECSGQPIVKFTSCGPKTYAYAQLEPPAAATEDSMRESNRNLEEYWYNDDDATVQKLKYSCKCKGFSLNSYNSEQVNYHTMADLIRGTVPWLKTKSLKFNWSRSQAQMTTINESKYLAFSYNKGYLDTRTWRIYPFGYEQYGEINNLN